MTDQQDDDLEAAKRIMARLVSTPPQPKGGKKEKEGEKKPQRLETVEQKKPLR